MSHAAPLGSPRNVASGRACSGIDVLFLRGRAVFAGGYSGQVWLTYWQARALGGNVHRGERGKARPPDAINTHR